MIKKFKNKRSISVLILIAYLSLFAANVYHYHNLNFPSNKFSFFVSNKTIKIASHSLENCIVQSTFNSVHHTLFKNFNFDNSIDEINNLPILDFSPNKKSFLIDSKKLRAPPFTLS
ncbi:MAG: hypothetical protein ACPL25_00305 [Ignavibacteria bacterium]